jgi:hypothetical protein
MRAIKLAIHCSDDGLQGLDAKLKTRHVVAYFMEELPQAQAKIIARH